MIQSSCTLVLVKSVQVEQISLYISSCNRSSDTFEPVTCSSPADREFIINVHRAIRRKRPPQSLSRATDLEPFSWFHSRSSVWSWALVLLTFSKFSRSSPLFLSPWCPKKAFFRNVARVLKFITTCPIQVHFVRVKLSMISSLIQFCGNLMPSIMREKERERELFQANSQVKLTS